MGKSRRIFLRAHVVGLVGPVGLVDALLPDELGLLVEVLLVLLELLDVLLQDLALLFDRLLLAAANLREKKYSNSRCKFWRYIQWVLQYY